MVNCLGEEGGSCFDAGCCSDARICARQRHAIAFEDWRAVTKVLGNHPSV